MKNVCSSQDTKNEKGYCTHEENICKSINHFSNIGLTTRIDK